MSLPQFLHIFECSHHARCSACDTLFNSLMDLEHHKEALGHWSDEDEDDEEDEEEESDIEYDYYYGKYKYRT